MGEEETISPRTAVTNSLPGIILDVAAAFLIWLFGRLVFLPISEGIDVFGYPLTEILNFIVLVSLIIIVLKIMVDVRVFIGGLTGWIAEKIGTEYEVTDDEINNLKKALVGIFEVVAIAFIYMLLADYMAGIHPALSGIVLIVFVIWAIFRLWGAVQAVSSEIRRYATALSRKAFD
jgi:hypothetical protein